MSTELLDEALDLLKTQVELLKMNQKRLLVEMGEVPNEMFNGHHNEQARKLQIACESISKEIRQVTDKIRKKGEGMSVAERMRVFVQWVNRLGQGDREEIYRQLAASESERPGGLPLSIG